VEGAEGPRAPRRISIRANGPYVVTGVPLRDADGGALETGSTFELCRCGRSSTKPFCDETHEAIDFDGRETADRVDVQDRRRSFEGAEITIYDARRLCAHAAVCTDNLPQVFDVTRPRWIDPDAAPADDIASVVARCPSGALAYAVGDDPDPVEPHLEPGILCSRGASYVVTGRVEVVGADGRPYERRERVTLCRCGASRNKPFCDGSHDDVDLGDG
jgi:CDGSH-type Zn-finger protein